MATVRNSSGNWIQEAKLIADDAAGGDLFGYAVAVDGDIAIIGAYGDDGGGSAYAFVRNNDVWTQQAKLFANDIEEGDLFGWSAAVSGDTVLIGARQDDDACPSLPACNSGSAYVFVSVGSGGWVQQAKLTAADAAPDDLFGDAVALDGNTALIGAVQDKESGLQSGSAYVFVRNNTGNWTQQTKLTAYDAAALDFFAASVAVSGDTAVIGAPLDDDGGQDSGSAYVFARSNGSWSHLFKLTAFDAASGDYFGLSAALSGATTIAG
ncbi:MAG: hypothetical protein GY862_29215 [Gammaproteobacteria bacterium]|nr:hypothetical protein [Gammaproteobacteria bacterium]